MISYEEAVSLIELEFDRLTLDTEVIALEKTVGRTLAEDVIADINMPPFNNSAVDGIAIKHDEETKEWDLIGEISAGNYKDFNPANNQAVRIMTGARVPDSCDAVIPLEDYSVSGDKIKLNDGVQLKKGMNIRPKASDVAEGETVAKRGSYITPRMIAAIASCGKTEVKVVQKLKFGILATGDELVPIDRKPEGDKIRASNHYALCAAVESLGHEAINFGFVNDDYSATKSRIEELIESDCDVVITTGGVSVGKYDFVKKVFAELGVEEVFWRAYIKPGKPCFFGKLPVKNKLIFGLPGNPVSCMVNFDVYIRPMISKIYGTPSMVKVDAELTNDVKKKDGKRHFVRANIYREEGKYYVTSKLSQSSGNLVGFSNSNCLIELEEDVRNPKKGEIVKCILM